MYVRCKNKIQNRALSCIFCHNTDKFYPQPKPDIIMSTYCKKKHVIRVIKYPIRHNKVVTGLKSPFCNFWFLTFFIPFLDFFKTRYFYLVKWHCYFWKFGFSFTSKNHTLKKIWFTTLYECFRGRADVKHFLNTLQNNIKYIIILYVLWKSVMTWWYYLCNISISRI